MADLAINQQIATFLALCKTASLSTVDEQGGVYGANVQFASDDAFCLHWVSAPASAHSRHIEANGKAAITIYAHQDTPEMIHGLQMRGRAEVLIDRAAEQAHALFVQKYPFVADPPYDKALSSQCFYRFAPTWLRWIDNRRGFGWKRELNL